ncbi:MAG: D-glycerate dehydrogenase [Rhodobacteraceae bacterium]|nr:MAG: D-glycerate dehydrogenase [Paracoccaceae bacterium]
MAAKPRVLVTRRWPKAAELALAERFDVTFNENDTPMSAEAITAAMREYDAVAPTVSDRITAEMLAAPSARILANYGVGFSHIATDAAKTAGVVVTNTPGVLTDCTADLAFSLMLAAARRLGEGERELRSGGWSGWRPTHMIGTKVSGATLGIVGFGRIGQAMARRAHHGFGMRVIFQDPYPVDPALAASLGAERRETVDDVVAEADFISLHCPGGDENKHLIDARRIGLMKPGAILVNTARGEVVDEAALAAALSDGRVAAAGLDVYEREPVVHPDLLKLENVVLAPHLGSATSETRVAMGMCAVENLTAFFAGREPPNRVA